MTDSLQGVGKHLGSYKERRWAEILEPVPEDTRTGDEIAFDVIQRVGLICRQPRD